MKALLVATKNNNEYTFLSNLLKRLGIYAKDISKEDLEDIGLSNLMKIKSYEIGY